MKNLDTSIQEAANYVLARGAVDQKEHLVLVGPDGKFLYTVDGDDESVSFADADPALIEQAVAIVHNHPGINGVGGSLSLPDLMSATAAKATIYAVDGDGSVYSSVGFPRMADEDLEHYNGAESIFVLGMSLYRSIGIVDTDIEKLAGHVINLMCSSQGMYSYEYKLGPKTQALLDKYALYLKPLLRERPNP